MPGHAVGLMGGKSEIPTLFDLIRLVGVDSACLCCLDAGAGASYPGSGTTWYDLSGNNRNVTIPNEGKFHGTPNGRSPNEYFTHNFNVSPGQHPDYELTDESFSFMDPWHTTSANFTVIVGVDMGGVATACVAPIATGVFLNGGFVAKGFALHRGSGKGTPNGFNNFRTLGRMYAIYQPVSGDNANAQGLDTGVDLPTSKFLMIMAAIKSGEQHFRVNDSSNNATVSWGGGNTNPSNFGGREYPRRAPGQLFGGSGSVTEWHIGHMAFFDTVLSAQNLQDIYNAYKHYRDPSLS